MTAKLLKPRINDQDLVVGVTGWWWTGDSVYHSVLHFWSLFICSFKVCNYSLPEAGLQFVKQGFSNQTICWTHNYSLLPVSWPVSLLGTECSSMLTLYFWMIPNLWVPTSLDHCMCPCHSFLVMTCKSSSFRNFLTLKGVTGDQHIVY